MVKLILCTLIIVSLLSCGNSTNIDIEQTPDVSLLPTTEIIQSPDELPPTTESNLVLDITYPPRPLEIVNLPDELYQMNESTYANNLRYDFIVKKRTDLTISVETLAGDFNLGIQDKDSKIFVYEMRNFQTDTDNVILEPGTYSIIIKESKHYGSYLIIGNSI